MAAEVRFGRTYSRLTGEPIPKSGTRHYFRLAGFFAALTSRHIFLNISGSTMRITPAKIWVVKSDKYISINLQITGLPFAANFSLINFPIVLRCHHWIPKPCATITAIRRSIIKGCADTLSVIGMTGALGIGASSIRERLQMNNEFLNCHICKKNRACRVALIPSSFQQGKALPDKPFNMSDLGWLQLARSKGPI
jgi:hypothetical protein